LTEPKAGSDFQAPVPDYEGGSIVNLMSSILTGLGSQAEPYVGLRQLDPKRLQAARNVVLMVIDGLGYDYLMRRGAGGALSRNLEARITSVFPPTTVSAITTFLTGLAPQQHGLTGWFTFFRELDRVVTVLPFKPRCGGPSFRDLGIEAGTVFDGSSVFERVQVRSYVVLPRRIVDSDYSRAHSGPAERLAYDSLEGYFQLVRDLLHVNHDRKYVFAYWPELDELGHRYGVESAEVAAHFADLDRAFGDFLESIQETQTALIVTADHGAIESGSTKRISLDDHPALANTLTLPLCGEPRTAFCYVHPASRRLFEQYVSTKLEHCATLFTSGELIEAGYFGLGEPHSCLADRVGDYALLMKDDYSIKDWLPGEQRFVLAGVHGGLSEEELYVPLIVAPT
jgi:arylsulfatase A-like enzyme